MQIRTSKGIVSVEDTRNLEQLQKAAKSLKINGYKLIKTPESLLAKIKEV